MAGRGVPVQPRRRGLVGGLWALVVRYPVWALGVAAAVVQTVRLGGL